MKVLGVIVARTDSHDATVIDSLEDERDHPFVYGATNPNIVPFKNVNLAVIRKFYKECFEEINRHLLYRISEEAYKHAWQWLKQEHLTKRIAEGVEKINKEVATLKWLRQQARRPRTGERDFREQRAALGNKNLLPLMSAHLRTRTLVFDVDCADFIFEKFFDEITNMMLAAVSRIAVGNDHWRVELDRRSFLPLQ